MAASKTTKVSKEELEIALKDPNAAQLLVQKYRKTLADPIRTSVLLAKDLGDYQEGRKDLKRKAEAKPWMPAKPGQRRPPSQEEFNGTIGRFGKKGQ